MQAASQAIIKPGFGLYLLLGLLIVLEAGSMPADGTVISTLYQRVLKTKKNGVVACLMENVIIIIYCDFNGVWCFFPGES